METGRLTLTPLVVMLCYLCSCYHFLLVKHGARKPGGWAQGKGLGEPSQVGTTWFPGSPLVERGQPENRFLGSSLACEFGCTVFPFSPSICYCENVHYHWQSSPSHPCCLQKSSDFSAWKLLREELDDNAFGPAGLRRSWGECCLSRALEAHPD